MAANFRNDTISIPAAARARNRRFAAAKAINPAFTPDIVASMGTTALYLKAMRGQDMETKTKYVQILFRQLRFLVGDFLRFPRADTELQARNEFLLKRDTRDPMLQSL